VTLHAIAFQKLKIASVPRSYAPLFFLRTTFVTHRLFFLTPTSVCSPSHLISHACFSFLASPAPPLLPIANQPPVAAPPRATPPSTAGPPRVSGAVGLDSSTDPSHTQEHHRFIMRKMKHYWARPWENGSCSMRRARRFPIYKHIHDFVDFVQR
jgi:hypothetical protein